MELGPYKLNRVHHGDALVCLRRLADACVHTCVTSPPYWGLRNYKLEPIIWGGVAGCEHEFEKVPPRRVRTEKDAMNHPKQMGNRGSYYNAADSDICTKCGAWRGSLGLEPTPGLYVEHLVQILMEVRRVLRADGTLWLNLGDSYAGGGGASGHTAETKNLGRPTASYGAVSTAARDYTGTGLKKKNLAGIPWRVAFALQAAGWWLRSDIIWAKPNPMPESVTDRPTRCHEYIFLLSKTDKYYYNNRAIMEPYKQSTVDRQDGTRVTTSNPDRPVGFRRLLKSSGRNKRSVWTIPVQPFRDAHFATFPPDLVRPCVRAGSSAAGHCPLCGVPWVPPGCKCGRLPVPCIVLDPFAGAGTTGVVAVEEGRDFLGFDLNEKYCTDIAAPRVEAARQGLKIAEYRAGQKSLFAGVEDGENI